MPSSAPSAQAEVNPVSGVVSDAAWHAALELMTRLGPLGSSHYIECRLGLSAPAPVDYLVAIDRYERDAARRALASHLDQPGLAGLRRTLEGWRDGEPLGAAPVVWAEFDDVFRQTPPRANACVSLVPSYADPFAALVSSSAAGALGVALEATRAIRGEPATNAEAARLAACLEGLPPGAHWIHLSVMAARQPGELKLYGAFPRDALLDYLERIGWRGSLPELENVIARHCPIPRTGPTLFVDLPLSALEEDGLGGLGVCFSQQQLSAASVEERAREALLRELERHQLASPAQALALASWSSPRGARRTRWLDIKLVYRSGAPLTAKAYLGFSTRARPVGLSL